jgi:hypothetical protein
MVLLLDTINEEIKKDRSLAEFQGKQPVPWQLNEIMEQRANEWVQRRYDLCCEAYKNSGKAVSEDFDRAVWAYCVEPFIDIQHQTASGLLALLLCAVGSPQAELRFLVVSQRNCCLAVRGKIHFAWFYKLNHVPSPTDEAVAALSRYKAFEARAARIATGLAPDPPPVMPPTPTPPLAEPVVSVSPQAPPVPPPVTVATFALNAVQNTSAAELLGGSLGAHTLSKAAAIAKWEDIEITFLSDERVQICNGGNRETRNYTEFGFEDGRSGKPNRAWEALRVLSARRGIIGDAATVGKWPKFEKRVQEIRKVLRKHFRISADPIPFVEGIGYQALFKISCRPSFDT